MRIDCQSSGFLFKTLTLGVVSAHAHGHLHQNALTPSARTRVIRWIRSSGHRTSYTPIYLPRGICRDGRSECVCKKDTRDRERAMRGTTVPSKSLHTEAESLGALVDRQVRPRIAP
jgi:hypothetical protein